MTTILSRKLVTKPRLICEGCQLEADTLFTTINGAYLCEDCAERDD